MKDFGFEIDPEELPFWDEDDLGEDEPRIVEWMVKKLREFDTIDILDPVAFAKAMTLIKKIISDVKECCESAEYEVHFDPVLGQDMFLRIVAHTMSFDKDMVAEIRALDNGMIGAIDVSGRLDGQAELTISFKDVRVRFVG